MSCLVASLSASLRSRLRDTSITVAFTVLFTCGRQGPASSLNTQIWAV